MNIYIYMICTTWKNKRWPLGAGAGRSGRWLRSGADHGARAELSTGLSLVATLTGVLHWVWCALQGSGLKALTGD